MNLLGLSVFEKRLQHAVESLGWFGTFVVIFWVIVFSFVSLRLKRQTLVLAYLVMLMFSGASISLLDHGSTLCRWFLIFCLALSACKGWRFPGWPCTMIGAYSLFLIVSVLWSPFPLHGLQFAVLLFLITLPAGGAIRDELHSKEDLVRVIKYYGWVAAIFVVTALAGKAPMEGNRFSGGIESAPLFVITGGILLIPLVAMFFVETQRRNRNILLCLSVAVFTASFLSGQRSGFFAGILGLLPMFYRFAKNQFTSVALITLITCTISVVALETAPDQRDFLERRYLTLDVNGRASRWEAAFRYCMDAPFTGHGVESDRKRRVGFHNAFLKEWHNGGIVGLVLFFGAFLVMGLQSLDICFRRNVPQGYNDIGYVLLGWSIALGASAMFESKLSSPSNIQMFTTVICSVIIATINSYYPSNAMLTSVSPGLSDRSYRPPLEGTAVEIQQVPR